MTKAPTITADDIVLMGISSGFDGNLTLRPDCRLLALQRLTDRNLRVSAIHRTIFLLNGKERTPKPGRAQTRCGDSLNSGNACNARLLERNRDRIHYLA